MKFLGDFEKITKFANLMKKKAKIVIPVILGLVALFIIVAAAFDVYLPLLQKPVYEKKVTLISSYSSESEREVEFIDRVQRELEHEGFNVMMSPFFLDSNNDTIHENIVQKVALALDQPTDLVILNDDLATTAFLELGIPKAFSVPVVFAGVSDIETTQKLMHRHKNVTGAWDKIDYRRNVELILDLISKDASIVSFIEQKDVNSYHDFKREAEMIGNVKFNEYYLHKAMPESPQFSSDSTLQMQIEKSKSSNVAMPYTVITVRFYEPGNEYYGLNTSVQYIECLFNTGYGANELAQAINYNGMSFSAVNEPMQYWNAYVSGYMTTLETQAHDAAMLASRILGGDRPTDIDPIYSKKDIVVDWNKIDWQNTTYREFPNDTVYLNMPAKEQQRSVRLIVALSIGAFVLLVISIMALQLRIGHKLHAHTVKAYEEQKNSMTLMLRGAAHFLWQIQDNVLFARDFFNETESLYPMEQIFNFIHPDDLELFKKDYQNALTLPLEDLRQVSHRYRAIFISLDYIWWELRYTVSETPDGKRLMSGVASNVQHLMTREQVLLDQAMQLELAVRDSVAYIWKIDANGVVTATNPRDGKQIANEPIRDFAQRWVDPKQLDKCVKYFEDAVFTTTIQPGQHTYRVKGRYKGEDYTWCEMRFNISEKDGKRSLSGFIFSVQREVELETDLLTASHAVQMLISPLEKILAFLASYEHDNRPIPTEMRHEAMDRLRQVVEDAQALVGKENLSEHNEPETNEK